MLSKTIKAACALTLWDGPFKRPRAIVGRLVLRCCVGVIWLRLQLFGAPSCTSTNTKP
jgi:hypothetical protein